MPKPIDDHFLQTYRHLLDAEDLAFDELEHACEEGDRRLFDEEFSAWQDAFARKVAFLQRNEISIPVAQPISL